MNSTNWPAITTTVRVNDATQSYAINLTNLTNKLIYHIFITTMNDWPGFNELLADTSVERIEAKTLKIRSKLLI